MNDPRYSEIHVRELPPLRVVSCRVISATPEEDVARQVSELVTEQELPPLRTFGFDVEVAPEQGAAGLRGYEMWVVAPPGVEPGEEMQLREFRGGLYAVMTIYDAFDDPFARVPAGWEHLHNWVTVSPLYEGAEHQMLEEVVAQPRVTEGAGASEYGPRRHMAIYYPVARIAIGVPA